MNEGGTGYKSKAYLVADMDFSGPLPITRQFCIFSGNPYHEPGLGPNRTWAVLMVRGASSFDKARKEILHDLEFSAELFPFYGRILQLLDESPDAETHALKYKLPEALDAYIATMPAPDHKFFRRKEYLLQIVGREACHLSRKGEPPFWTLNFVGMGGAARAAREAVRFLKNRGEQLVGGLGLTDFDPKKPAWTYLIKTDLVAGQQTVS